MAMVLNKIFCGLDTIYITITRPRSLISFTGENAEPTDKLFYGILDILIGRNFVIQGGSKKFVNNGSEYIQSNSREILVQLRSAHLMKYGRTKVGTILKFLSDSGVKPKAKRTRKKDFKNEKQDVFYQITRIDFAVDYETRIDLIKVLTERVGYTHFFSGIPKDYFYRVIHHSKRTNKDTREHRFKEFKIFNAGFELAIYDKRLEIAEQATAEKLQLYPPIYRDILLAPERKLYRVELRFFRTRSIAFNHLTVDELFDLPTKELNKFGEATKLLKRKKQKIIPSILFSRLFTV
jgi:hypothetical protein